MKITKLQMALVSFTAMMLMSGCGTTNTDNNAMSTTSSQYAAVNPNHVKLYYDNSSKPRHYKVIGRVSVDDYSYFGSVYSQQKIADDLRKQAASIGGNGIININTGLEQTTGDVIIAKQSRKGSLK